MTFKEAYTICYEYQKDKIKDSTLKTYGERIKYMGLLDNVELVDLDWDLYQKWRAQIIKTNLCDRYKTDIQQLIKQVINFAEKQWDFNLRNFYKKLEPFKTPVALIWLKLYLKILKLNLLIILRIFMNQIIKLILRFIIMY